MGPDRGAAVSFDAPIELVDVRHGDCEGGRSHSLSGVRRVVERQQLEPVLAEGEHRCLVGHVREAEWARGIGT